MKEKDQLRGFCFVFFPSGPLLDCNAWTLPAGIRKFDGPAWSSRVRTGLQHGQCKTVSFLGGIPRDGGDGGKQGGSSRERKKPGEMQQPA